MISEESLIFDDLLEKVAIEAFNGTGLHVALTGTFHLNNLTQKYLLESLIKGFSLAFISIIGILFLAFRSIKYGGLSILPNLLPITWIIGIMGLTRLALNTATVMVASIALGVAVDDTIHFISRFKKELKSNKLQIQDSLRNTTVYTGNAIIFTSIINISGFLVLLISGLRPTREFGILISLALAFALIGDLIILPASIMGMRKLLSRNQPS
jgi:predicted RND superfamily exporter protein